MNGKEKTCRCFLVSGKVQGVWFRASTRNQALKLGISGYARNLADGSVEVIACADDARIIELMEKWLWEGPPMASVSRVERLECSGAGTSQAGFSIR